MKKCDRQRSTVNIVSNMWGDAFHSGSGNWKTLEYNIDASIHITWFEPYKLREYPGRNNKTGGGAGAGFEIRETPGKKQECWQVWLGIKEHIVIKLGPHTWNLLRAPKSLSPPLIIRCDVMIKYMMRCNTIWYTWCKWHDCDMIYDVILYIIAYMIWHMVCDIWYDMLWYNKLQYMIQYYMIWYDASNKTNNQINFEDRLFKPGQSKTA